MALDPADFKIFILSVSHKQHPKATLHMRMGLTPVGRTPRGSCDNTLLRRVLRRLETAFEKVLRRDLRRCLAVGFKGEKGSKKGS